MPKLFFVSEWHRESNSSEFRDMTEISFVGIIGVSVSFGGWRVVVVVVVVAVIVVVVNVVFVAVVVVVVVAVVFVAVVGRRLLACFAFLGPNVVCLWWSHLHRMVAGDNSRQSLSGTQKQKEQKLKLAKKLLNVILALLSRVLLWLQLLAEMQFVALMSRQAESCICLELWE